MEWEKKISLKVAISEIENRKTVKNINKTKIWYFWKNKIDKRLARLTKKKRRLIINERGDITADITEI